MAWINGEKFFKLIVVLFIITGCNQEDSNTEIFFKVKETKDYTQETFGNKFFY